MTGQTAKAPGFQQKQMELREQCRHPAGTQQPIDWSAPLPSIPERISELARNRPDQLAAYDPRTSRTYAELDGAANQVANAILGARGPGREVIALLLGVDVPAVTAALGVLKAGKIYVALEPSFPRNRLLHMLADTEARLIVTDGPHLAQARELAGANGEILQLEGLSDTPASAPHVPIQPGAPALLNYTSGSTGQPKGVLQSHGSAYWQAVRYASDYNLSDADRLSFCGTLANAASFWVIFGPLCLGAATAPFDIRRHGLHELGKWLLETEPTLFGGLTVARRLAHNQPHQRFESIRVLSMGGDTIFREDVLACMRTFPNALVATGYGLTEAGRATQLLLDAPEMLQWGVLPLGLPVPGRQVEILTDDGRRAQPGEVGEIVILGPGLAAGYWQRPELTEARFRPIEGLGPERAYLTGDLGRMTEDGLLHHVGRRDHMVKIRGYQVHTNEIEGILRDVHGVTEACVTAHALPEGMQRLVAYLVVDRESFPGPANLHARFKHLPRHMAPQSYVFLDALPKTETGRKVDRSLLPLPRRSRLAVSAVYVAPRDPTEEALARIWGKVLEIEGLGVHDNFLELGGDSLDSTRIISLVAAFFQVEISLSRFFEVLTIAEMADLVREARKASAQRAPDTGAV